MTKQQIDDEVKKITAQLIEKYKPEKIILFGSAARGDNEVNDLDFMIIKKDVPYYGLDRMREVRKLISTESAVDMLVVSSQEWQERVGFGDSFINTVLEEGKILYG